MTHLTMEQLLNVREPASSHYGPDGISDKDLLIWPETPESCVE